MPIVLVEVTSPSGWFHPKSIINLVKAYQKNLGVKNITVVTDPHSLEHAQKTLGKKLIKKAINNLIVVDKDKKFKNTNIRLYKDTSHTVKNLSFYNVNRCDAYDLSPYDETILLDADYLILSNTLNQCWGHNNELMMNWKYQFYTKKIFCYIPFTKQKTFLNQLKKHF